MTELIDLDEAERRSRPFVGFEGAGRGVSPNSWPEPKSLPDWPLPVAAFDLDFLPDR